MQRLISLVLAIAMLVQISANLAIIGLFKWNQNYIAKNLCENKAKPQLKCCGSCYLKKQIRKAGERENGSKNAPSPKVDRYEVAFIIPSLLHLSGTNFIPQAQAMHTPVHQHMYGRPYVAPHFHPPSYC